MVATAATTATVLVAAYALGCINAGYYLVRAVQGRDVRQQGSGATGATNVGRALGRWGYFATFGGDASKAAIALALARMCELSPAAQWLTALVVLVGHIHPVQLGGRGGKGVSPWIGAVLVLDPVLVLITAALTALAWLPLRRFPYAGLAALTTTPGLAYGLDRGPTAMLGLTALLALLLFAHRANLRAAFHRAEAA